MNVDRSVDGVKDKLNSSSIVYKNLKWKEIALYLRYSMQAEQVERFRHKQFIPKRKFNRGAPLFTRSGSMKDPKIRHQPWIFSRIEPGEDVIREMFCEAVAIMIKRTQ